ncbi:MAG: prephenate dehydrogenase [Chloroflexi bacterium]|nr:prephenate dehydrogenase [Chloroflexota bacterium]
MADRAEVRVGIVGLGRVGASIALALRRHNRNPKAKYRFEIQGYDRQQGTKEALKERDAADILNARNPQRATREADLVVLAQPYHEIEASLREMAGALREGAVVLNLSLLQLPAVAWAEKYLSEGRYHVGGQPMIQAQQLFTGLDETRFADEALFDGAQFYLMPAANCPAEAVELTANFARILGARTTFMDAAEYDALVSATELLPSLLGVAAFHTLASASGWNDTQRLTNPSFAQLTHHLFDVHPDALAASWLRNQESLTRQLDGIMQVLLQLRDMLREEDRDGVEALLSLAAERYEGWINRRNSGQFDPVDTSVSSAVSAGGMMRSLFWFGGNKQDDDNSGKRRR